MILNNQGSRQANQMMSLKLKSKIGDARQHVEICGGIYRGMLFSAIGDREIFSG